jgi:hypothetical protein
MEHERWIGNYASGIQLPEGVGLLPGGFLRVCSSELAYFERNRQHLEYRSTFHLFLLCLSSASTYGARLRRCAI